MITLCFHLATDPVGMTLVSGSRILQADTRPSTHEFTEHLSDYLDAFCRRGGVPFKALGGLCFTVGPGNYTGTRLAVSVGKTLAQALEIPLFTLSTLEAYVWHHWPHEGVYLSVLETRPPALRVALFRINGDGVSRLTPDIELDPTQLETFLGKFTDPITVVGPTSCPDIFGGLAQFMGVVEAQGRERQVLDQVMPIYAYPPVVGKKKV